MGRAQEGTVLPQSETSLGSASPGSGSDKAANKHCWIPQCCLGSSAWKSSSEQQGLLALLRAFRVWAVPGLSRHFLVLHYYLCLCLWPRDYSKPVSHINKNLIVQNILLINNYYQAAICLLYFGELLIKGICLLLHHRDCMKGNVERCCLHSMITARWPLSGDTVWPSNSPVLNARQEMMQSPRNIWESVWSGAAFLQVTIIEELVGSCGHYFKPKA